MLVIKDFATTILASALTAAATSVVVSDASRLPALSAGDYYYLVLQKFTDRTNVEVVKVTGAAGNTLTVVRAQAGTTAKSFAIGDYAEQRVTVGTFSEYIAQSVADKVDKSGAVVEQSLSFLNTGDLVSAGVGIAYEGNRHVTALGGGVGANTVNPFVALRPLGKDNSSVQAIYDLNGNFALLGGERKAEIGKLVSLTPADAFGWPNAIANDANNYSTRFRQKVSAGNNALYILADGATNARRFGIQSGHESPAYANVYGILDLNPFGGAVRVNGGTVYHTNYVPTPAAVGALALVGGTLTGPLGVRPSVGVNPLDLFCTPASSGTSAQGVAGWDNTGAAREWGVGRYATAGVAEYAYFGFGDAPWNSGLRVYGAGDIRAGAANRLYHEGYLPTPDVLGAVPQARTINSKPLTSNITLSAADVGAVNNNAWGAKVKLGTWSAICKLNVPGTLAGKALLTVGHTRGNVVINAQFLVSWGHFKKASVMQLQSHGYTQFKVRVAYINNNDCCFEVFDAVYAMPDQVAGLEVSYSARIDNLFGSYVPFTAFTASTGEPEPEISTEYNAIKINTNKVYHQGFKPTAADVGALPSDSTAVAATKLATARQINGTNFDGTANITTANWGTARTLTIGNAAKSVNGGADVSWSLAEIGAVPQARTINTKPLTSDIVLSAADVGAVPQARTINSKPLTANITLSAADVGAAPAGFGLGGYGTSISTVLGDCNLRRQSGFFQGFNIAGIPNGAGWTYLFNQAHGNAAGYFGYLAISFAGTQAWIGGQEGGTQKGPYELVKRGDSILTGRVEVNAGTNPMLEFHMPGKHAVCQYLDASGNFRLGTSNGAGGEVTLRAQFAANGELYVNGNGNFNDVYIRSDIQLKTNLDKVSNALHKVGQLQGYTYDKRKSLASKEIVGREAGIIAQDLRKVLPEAVKEAEDTSLTISNSAVTALLVEAIKELKTEIDQLRRLINGT